MNNRSSWIALIQLFGFFALFDALLGILEILFLPDQPPFQLRFLAPSLIRFALGFLAILFAEKMTVWIGYRKAAPDGERKEQDELSLWLLVVGVLCAFSASFGIIFLILSLHKKPLLPFLMPFAFALCAGLLLSLGASWIARWMIRMRLK